MKRFSRIVIGDGWAATATVGILLKQNQSVLWASGTGSRMIAPLPTLEWGKGVSVWQYLANLYGVETGDPRTGSFLREFRNKSFREALWTKAPTPEARKEVRDECVWLPESRIAPAFETRFERSLVEIEEELRAKIISEIGANRIEGLPLSEVKVEEGIRVEMGSGEIFQCEQLIYADRLGGLAGVKGMSRGVHHWRGRNPNGIVQAIFEHESPVGSGMSEGFFGAIHKEAGEEIQRSVWGHFYSHGNKSVWSACLGSDEAEDNHEIAKKFRRIKQALEKMFADQKFLESIKKETVRFQEGVLFGLGAPLTSPFYFDSSKNIAMLSDGYGPSYSFEQVGSLFDLNLAQTEIDTQSGQNPEISSDAPQDLAERLIEA